MRRLFNYKMRFSFQSILFALSITGVTFFLGIISMLLYYNTKMHINDRLDFINTTKFNQIVADVEYFFDNTRKSMNYLKNNKQLIANMRNVESAATKPYEKNVNLSEIDNTLLNIQMYNEYILSINIVTENLQYYHGQYLYDFGWSYKNVDKLDDDVQLKYPGDIFQSASDEAVNSILKKNLDEELFYFAPLMDNNIKYGNVYLFLNDKKFANKLSGIKDIMIINGSGKTIYQGSAFRDNATLLNSAGQTYRKQLTFHDWTIIYKINWDVYQKQLELLRVSAYFAFAISLLFTFVFSGYLSKQILHPAIRLISLVKRYNIGDVNITEAIQADSQLKMKMTLREKVFYYFIVTIILPICFFVAIFYMQSNKIIRQNIIEAYSLVFQKTASDLNIFMEKKEKLLVGLSLSTAVQNTLINPNDDGFEEMTNDMVEKFIYLGLDDDKYSLYNSANQLILSNGFRHGQQISEPFLADLKKDSRKIKWSLDKDRNNKDIVKLGMEVINIKSNRIMGYSLIEMDYGQFTDVYRDSTMDDAESFVLGLNDIDYPNQPELQEIADHIVRNSGVDPIQIEGSKQLLFYERIGSRNLYFVSVFNSSALFKLSFTTILNNIYTFIVLLLFLILLSFYVSWMLLKPINKINKLLDFPKSVHFEKLSEDYYYINEIQELNIKFIRMIERIDDLIDDLLILNSKKHEVEIEKKTAEIHALQAQINPHFLQNTLDNTVYMIKNDHKTQAVSMIKSLSSLFRFGISRGENIIDIQEELKYVKAYVNIINIRHNNRINFIWEIDDSLLFYKTLKLTLQPIIENAIHHGIFNKREDAVIRIECLDAGDFIQFKVTDNGKGISADELADLHHRLNSKHGTDSVGLYNVQSRIRLYFGGDFGLSIDSVQGEGTTVALSIPKITNPNFAE